MIASTALELLLLGLAVWQLVVVRRGIRADREKAARERHASDHRRPDTEASSLPRQ